MGICVIPNKYIIYYGDQGTCIGDYTYPSIAIYDMANNVVLQPANPNLTASLAGNYHTITRCTYASDGTDTFIYVLALYGTSAAINMANFSTTFKPSSSGYTSCQAITTAATISGCSKLKNLSTKSTKKGKKGRKSNYAPASTLSLSQVILIFLLIFLLQKML
jgi:disulfide bond formation protein DsbB